MDFRDALLHIRSTFWDAKKGPFKDSPVAEFIRREVPTILSSTLALDERELIVEASPGKGRWSTSPWIRIADPTVSDSAERGFYPVYLFSVDAKTVVLTLLQGTTSVRQEFKKDTHVVLRSRASILAAKVPEHTRLFSTQTIDLGLTAKDQDREDWEAASAFAKTYYLASLPSNASLLDDAKAMVDLYRKVILRGGLQVVGELESSESAQDGDPSSIDGRRRMKRHKTIERNRKLAQKAKQFHGTTCQACGANMEQIYGDIGRGYIEAHHLVPLATIEEEGGVLRDPRTDFAVLCPNCHRMIHLLGAPPLEEFRPYIRCRVIEHCTRVHDH